MLVIERLTAAGIISWSVKMSLVKSVFLNKLEDIDQTFLTKGEV